MMETELGDTQPNPTQRVVPAIMEPRAVLEADMKM